MANIFIDSNFLFDVTERDKSKREMLNGNRVFVSALSYHILFYTYKYKVPQKEISDYKNQFYITDFTNEILSDAMYGPTFDLEDNIQLHSAVIAEVDYFLTSDKKLLKMKYFGKMKIVNTLQTIS